jgi:hypothetical protein
MRRSLGAAVFSGMLGVTLFGVVLTPVFFYVLQALSQVEPLRSPRVRWIGSLVLGVLAGLLLGFLLWRVTQSELTYQPLRLSEMWDLLFGNGVLTPERRRVLTRLLWFLAAGVALGVLGALMMLRVFRSRKSAPADGSHAADAHIREALP